MQKSNKTFIIAEMAWAHDGSLEKAKKIAKAASDAGADAVGIHITSMPDYMVKRYGSNAGQTLSAGNESVCVYDYLVKINLKKEEWAAFFSYTKKLGLKIAVMPNDRPSLKFSSALKPDIYVIAAACFTEEDFVALVAKEKKPVVLRIGGATLGEIENTVRILQKGGATNITLLHGIQLYPTHVADTHVNLLSSLRAIFGLPVGIADHVDAKSDLALVIPLLAIPLGVSMIEKHLTHDRSLKGEDIEAALNPDEFATFVRYVRACEEALGENSFREFSKGELTYRNVSRKKIVAAKILKKGEVMERTSFTFKRSDIGLPAGEAKHLIGKKAKRAIAKDEGITWENIR